MAYFCDFASGWISGMCGLMVGHPFDTIKVIQQTQAIGTTECVKTIYKQHGYKGYFRGLGFPLITNGAVNSLFFGVYGAALDSMSKLQGFKWYSVDEELKYFFDKDSLPVSTHLVKLTWLDYFIAGSIGGLATISIACPIDLIKIKLQTSDQASSALTKHLSKGTYPILKHVVSTEGFFKGLYRGWIPMFFRDVIGYGANMMFFEMCSDPIKNHEGFQPDDWKTFLGLFIAGGLAGTASWWVVIPLDVIKSRIQADDPCKPKYHGIADCTRKVLKETGFRGFFSGFIPISVRGFPVNGATFLSFELLFRACNHSKKKIEALKSSLASSNDKPKN